VAAQDPSKQEKVVLQQVERAIEAGAGIIVFPELTTSPAMTALIERRLAKDDRQRLVICGSWHEFVTGNPANNSVGLISGIPSRMRHRKLVEFGDLYPANPDDRRREGIKPPDPPLLRIYVADQFRFSLTICKDFLNEMVEDTLDHVGANVLLVPALSRTTHPFKRLAGAHISRAQAVSVVANGPRTMQGALVAPTAFLARPYEPDDLIEDTAVRAPSVLLFFLRSGTSQEV
jgi:predicted amidohydrolase